MQEISWKKLVREMGIKELNIEIKKLEEEICLNGKARYEEMLDYAKKQLKQLQP